MHRLLRPGLLLSLLFGPAACQWPGPIVGEGARPAAQACREPLARVAGCERELAAAEGARDALRDSCAGWRDAFSALRAEVEAAVAAGAAAEQPAEAAPDSVACDGAAAPLAGKLVVGRREQVWLDTLELMLPARIDTGAETASLDARDIQEFERDGDAWVRFEVVHPQSGERVPLERPVARVVRIIQSSSEEAERRPVVELGIVLGGLRQRAEFTLSDRSHLDFQVLVGRNILKDLMVVDVGQENVAPPRLDAALPAAVR